jgi:hypothetical protein
LLASDAQSSVSAQATPIIPLTFFWFPHACRYIAGQIVEQVKKGVDASKCSSFAI